MRDIPDLTSLRHHPLVWIIIAACGAGYGLFYHGGHGAIAAWLLPDSFDDMRQTLSYWTLVTPIFIHFTTLHLLVNAYTFWLFGSKVERESMLELLLLVTVSATISNSAQWWATDAHFGGLSGVVYGLLGYCGVRSLIGGEVAYQSSAELNIVMLLLIPVAATGLFGSFSDVAHISGLIAGVALGFIRLQAKQMVKQRLSNDQ